MRNLADYYHWEETERGIRIYVHSRTADRLQAEVLEAANSSAHRGAEVGGILLGSIETLSAGPVVFIEDFEPVPGSHRNGPAYELPGEETTRLEAALLRRALAGCESPAAPAIIGYYRSHLREGLSMSEADVELADSYFQTPNSVFLIVKTVAGTKACTAGFFFWEDGQIQPEFSSLEVALGRTEPAAVEQPAPAAAEAPADDFSDGLPDDLTKLFAETAAAQPAEPAEPEPPRAIPIIAQKVPTAVYDSRAWRGLLVRAATIVIAAAALVISVVTYLGGPRAPGGEAAATKPAPSALGLQVERNPPDILVSWNRYAREIAVAERATLSVRDGKSDKIIKLNKSQIAAGSYLYTATGDDVLLRLEVFADDDSSIAQSLRVRMGPLR